MRYSTQSTNLAALGLNGSTFITGTQEYSGNWACFRTVDASTTIAGITGHSSISGISYFAGKSLTPPYEFLGQFTNIRLTTGALQAFNF